jgi:hypothetical protein
MLLRITTAAVEESGLFPAATACPSKLPAKTTTKISKT